MCAMGKNAGTKILMVTMILFPFALLPRRRPIGFDTQPNARVVQNRFVIHRSPYARWLWFPLASCHCRLALVGVMQGTKEDSTFWVNHGDITRRVCDATCM